MRTPLSYTSLVNYGIGGGDYARRWKNPGDEKTTDVPSFIYPLNSDRDAFYAGSERNTEKGDHIRLQFINIAYTFLKKIKNLPFSGLQLYFNAGNLGVIWRANKYHIDPDYVNAIPNPKTYAFGLRANF